jgi:hypothetical protein
MKKTVFINYSQTIDPEAEKIREACVKIDQNSFD